MNLMNDFINENEGLDLREYDFTNANLRVGPVEPVIEFPPIIPEDPVFPVVFTPSYPRYPILPVGPILPELPSNTTILSFNCMLSALNCMLSALNCMFPALNCDTLYSILYTLYS